ncbi:MAG TPA: hypothetical protein VEA37_02245 [Flavobacterium sp.]|nr:hypothetical protein [Flavobacterium sp.]
MQIKPIHIILFSIAGISALVVGYSFYQKRFIASELHRQRYCEIKPALGQGKYEEKEEAENRIVEMAELEKKYPALKNYCK